VSRTLSTAIQNKIDDSVTDPYYLIQMGFSPILYYSTLYDMSVDGHTYDASRTAKVAFKTNANGTTKGTITIDNADNAISTTVLGESPSGLSCVIYGTYGSNPATADLTQIFEGEMDKAVDSGNTVKIDIFSTGSEFISPGLVIAKPYFNWLPPAGTIITSGTNTIVLESAN